jgi:hypothetical protein
MRIFSVSITQLKQFGSTQYNYAVLQRVMFEVIAADRCFPGATRIISDEWLIAYKRS